MGTPRDLLQRLCAGVWQSSVDDSAAGAVRAFSPARHPGSAHVVCAGDDGDRSDRCSGRLAYWPNFVSTSHLGDGPVSWSDRFAAFWFDTTKVDWRESMVMGVRSDQLADRAGMWWFDARQQFGVLGLPSRRRCDSSVDDLRPWATLVLLAYTINTLFAFTYNVGTRTSSTCPATYSQHFWPVPHSNRR